MTVVGAAFATKDAATAAQKELIDRLHLDSHSLEHAPLGAVGRRAEGKQIVAARVLSSDVPVASQIIARHGGEIVIELTTPAATGVIRVEAGAETRQ